MTDRGTVGVIEKVSCRFLWTISEFTALEADVGDFFWSPDVQSLDNVWNLCIYPKGTHSNRGFIMLQVLRKNMSAGKPIRFSLSIQRRYLSEKEIIRNQRFDNDTCFSSGLLQYMQRNVLLNERNGLMHNEQLRVILAIWIDEPTFLKDRKLDSAESETKNLPPISTGEENFAQYDQKGDDPTLRQHLEDMLLAGDDHDVTIKVKDQQFRAHKGMLRARSPVFAAMFKHKMKESTDDSISIDDCDPESFGEFLHYIYTGKVKNLSLSNAMGLYYAADKYDFSRLKKICVEFLKTSLSTTVITDVITLVIKHSENELLECAMVFFSKQLEEIMSSVEWQRYLLDNPIQANEICLKAVKIRSLKT